MVSPQRIIASGNLTLEEMNTFFGKKWFLINFCAKYLTNILQIYLSTINFKLSTDSKP